MGIGIQPCCCDPHVIYHDAANGSFDRYDFHQLGPAGFAKRLWREGPSTNGGYAMTGGFGVYGAGIEKRLFYWGQSLATPTIGRIFSITPYQKNRTSTPDITLSLGLMALDYDNEFLYGVGPVGSATNWHVYRMNLDGSGLTTIKTYTSASETYITYTAYGRMVYSRSRDAVCFLRTNDATAVTGDAIVERVSADGTATVLTTVPRDTFSWAPQQFTYDPIGETLYFCVNRGSGGASPNTISLYSCPIDGGSATLVKQESYAVPSSAVRFGTIYADAVGRRLLYVQSRPGISGKDILRERSFDESFPDRPLYDDKRPQFMSHVGNMRAGTGFIEKIDENWI